jgi:signal transduction histidine kinase
VDERRLARKAEVAELLLHAARRLGETLEPERVYETFHELLREVVPHDGLVVSSYDERDDLIRCDYAWVEGNVVDPSTLPPLPLNQRGGGMQSRVIVSGEPIVFNDVAERVQEPGGTYYNVDREGTVKRIPETGPAETSAAMMVPVKHEGRVVGVVQVMADRGAYTDEQLEVMEGLVAQMAATVRTARLQREWRRLEAAEAAARAVAEERESAAHVLEVVGDGIFFVDADGIVGLWNRAAAVVTGVHTDRIVGRRLEELVPGWEGLVESVPAAEGGDTPRSVTLPVAIGGRDLWLSFVAVRSPEGVVYAFRDVTVERRLDEERNDIVATISHELRTPIAAVYGAAQTLIRRDIALSSGQGRQLLELVVAQASRLAQIVEEVLLASKLDRGEVPLATGPADLAQLVPDTVDAVEAQLDEPVEIAVAVAREVAPASGDPDRIQQVLMNLLDNALKYGAPPVRITVDDANGMIRVAVSDAGPGIEAADRERLFEKFFRAEEQLRHGPGGTGLGLYISRELVRRMGGRLEVQSAPGAGATFVLELPRI